MARILVLDGGATRAQDVKRGLEAAGFEVEIQPEGEQALERLRASPFDLLVSGVAATGPGGHELCRRIRADAALADLAVILATALADPAAILLALESGADGLVAWPVDPERLADRVTTVLSNRRAPGTDAGEVRLRDKKLTIESAKDRILGFLVSLAEEASHLDRELAAASRRSLHDTQKLTTTAQISEEKYRRLVDQANDLIVVLDSQGRILEMNRRTEELLGRSRAERIGGSAFDFIPAEARPRALELFAGVLEGRVKVAEGIRVARPDGSVAVIDFSAAPIPSDEGPLLLAIGRDVTEARRLQAHLMVADRMATIGTLASGVAHEINNPLASVMANLNLAIKQVDGEVKDEIRDALEAAERVRQIVRGMRVFARADDDDRVPVDVRKVMESSLRMAWTEIRHRARLVKDYGRVPAVSGSEARLGQVFLNLLVNAAHSIPEGHADANEIRVVTSLDPAGQVVIRISDTGCGMPPEVLGRLFTPFFTTKSPGMGTGLGLSICHSLVSAMGGQIQVESEVGKGTTFRMLLPPAILQAPDDDAERETPPSAARRGSVLVVDDDASVCMVVRRILGAEHDVVTSSRAEEALARIQAGERFDVILCDLLMPQMTGMELYAEVLRFDPVMAARMVFMTAGAFTPRARAFLDQVPNHRMEKPFDPRGLRALINDQIR